MTVSWKPRPDLFWVCLLLCPTGVVLQQFQLEPLSSTVLQGSDVRFTATVEGIWNIMTWNVRGLLVVTVVGSNITPSLEGFSATFCSNDTSCVEFIIHNVTRKETGPVICMVQGEFGSRTAQLNVQESGTVSIMGGDITVQQDQPVEFQCTTTAWFPEPTISWTQDGHVVNSSLYNTTSTTDGSFYDSTSVLRFQAVSNTMVTCLATVQSLTNPQNSSVFLVVVPRPVDRTVLIAVVSSIGGCALLVLLILGIIFCCKRRKEKRTSYQDEMRRVKSQAHGEVNTVYVPEDRQSASYSEFSDSGFYQQNGSNIVEVHHVRNDQTGNGYNSAYNNVDQPDFRKHRHATIV